MISKLYDGVGAGLKKVKNCTIYRKDVPENFKTPSFIITFYDQDPSRGINGRLKNSVMVDILYFPEDESNYQEECWNIGQDLTRKFQISGFKIKNRSLKITDKVLHFMFDVDYREYLRKDGVKMGPMSIKENVKEE